MNKQILLPKLSIIGIKKNGATYFPYMIAGIFSVFVFFVFSSIMRNDIMRTLPHSGYVVVLMGVGLVLLGIILLPFLFYTNSFLIKRRKRELGLYSILGLEKKHIAMMMLWETLIIFGVTVVGGMVFGVVFSKLLFLVLMNLTGLSVDTSFSFSLDAFKQTLFFFFFAYGLNLMVNLFEVYRSNPNDLMKGAKKGDREPRFLWITATIGIASLAGGYYIAAIAELDSMIFVNFFLAVALVVIGTHYFFTAGMIALLKMLKGNKKFYYHKSNYVTVSGMIHRMKNSASSLANICIFSTMTVITLLCTASLWSGTDGILKNRYPYDVILNFNEVDFEGHEALEEKLKELAQSTGIRIEDQIAFMYQKLPVGKVKNQFVKADDTINPADRYVLKLMTVKEYNQMQKSKEELAEDEVLVFAKGSNFGYEIVLLEEEDFKVKRELEEIVFTPKVINDTFGQDFYLVVRDDDILDRLQAEFESFAKNDRIYTIRFQTHGSEEEKAAFISKLARWAETQEGFNNINNGISDRKEVISVNGGLLFLGIFFGIVFSMCLVLIMYYKQITEGFEDRDKFYIMQNVGMSDKEVKDTIKRQILIVFFLPLMMAVLHTAAGFGMMAKLLGTLNLFDTRLIIFCGIIVVGLFTGIYGCTYLITSKTYYRIVKQMN